MQSAMGQRLKTERALRLRRMVRVTRADEPLLAEIFREQIKRRHLEESGNRRPDDGEVSRGFALIMALPQATERALIFCAASLLQKNASGGDAALRHRLGQLPVQIVVSGHKQRIIASMGILPALQQGGCEDAQKNIIGEPEPVRDQARAIHRSALENQRLALGAHTLEKPANPRETFSMSKSRTTRMQRQCRVRCHDRSLRLGELCDHVRLEL